MQNLTCLSPGQGCPLEEGVNPMTVHQGDCVNLDSDDDTYQATWRILSNEISNTGEPSLLCRGQRRTQQRSWSQSTPIT